jgi:hypothetical protein
MARKRYKPEEIVAKLRQVDVLVSQGQNMVDAIRQIGVSEVTYSCIEQVRAQLHVSERRACAALGQHRSTQRKVPRTLSSVCHATALSFGLRVCPLSLRAALWSLSSP